MPTYEYECRACGHRFERVQSFQDAPIRVCPDCSGETRRVIHPAGVIFKGSGWYINDSRKTESSAVTSTSKAGEADKAARADKTDKADKADGDAKPAADSKPGPAESKPSAADSTPSQAT
jgi:putative FmdB family regulatory protein